MSNNTSKSLPETSTVFANLTTALPSVTTVLPPVKNSTTVSLKNITEANQTVNGSDYDYDSDSVKTFIYGTNVDIVNGGGINYPPWFWYVIILGSVICFISFAAWIVFALIFYKKQKPCDHAIRVVVETEDQAENLEKPKNSKRSERADGGRDLEEAPGTYVESPRFSRDF